MARRANNEGSIYERRDGRWVASVTMPNGRRRSFYGRTQTEALQKKNDAVKVISEGLTIGPSRLTVGAWLDRWLEDVAKPSVRQNTYTAYEEAIRLHLKPELGKRKLRELLPSDIRAFEQARVSQAGLHPNTVGRIHTCLRSALSAAERDGLIFRNPAKLVSPPRAPKVEREPFTPDEARRFLGECMEHRYGAVWTICLTAGLRSGEALGLQWRDIDLDRGRLSVRHTLYRSGKLDEPKSERSRRDLPLLPLAVDALKTNRARQAEERLMAGPLWEDTGLVFTTHVGRPLNDSNVLHAFHKFSGERGYRRQRIHDLRHACASLLAASGVPLEVVSAVLGHSSIQLTANLYAHIYESVKAQSFDKLGAMLDAR